MFLVWKIKLRIKSGRTAAGEVVVDVVWQWQWFELEADDDVFEQKPQSEHKIK